MYAHDKHRKFDGLNVISKQPNESFTLVISILNFTFRCDKENRTECFVCQSIAQKKTKTEMINDRNECSVGCHVFGILGLENISKNLIEMNIAYDWR